MFGENTIKNFVNFGIDTRHVSKVRGRSSGVAPIMVEPSGENSILIVKGANSDLLPVDIERAAEDLKTCDLILLQLEIPLETVYATIRFSQAAWDQDAAQSGTGDERPRSPANSFCTSASLFPTRRNSRFCQGILSGPCRRSEWQRASLDCKGNRNGDRHDGGARRAARDSDRDGLDRTEVKGHSRRHDGGAGDAFHRKPLRAITLRQAM